MRKNKNGKKKRGKSQNESRDISDTELNDAGS